MTAQLGKDLLLKVWDETANAGAGDYVNIGGFRPNGININGENVDVTSKDSGGFRQFLDGAGIRSVTATGSGVFMSDAAFQIVNNALLNAEILQWQIIVPNHGDYSGDFAISSLEMAGEHAGEVTFSLNLESAGAVAFTAV